MRRLPVFFLLCLSTLIAARPAHTPTPSPAPTATPRAAAPLVVVFPFEASSDIKEGSGQAAAQVFTQQMNADGGIDTLVGPPTVKRADYLKYATSINALYYVSGYMTPLGNGVSLVEQVVATRTGTIAFGQTAQIESAQDATAQATLIHDGILARERQLADAYAAAQAQATAEPSGGSQADLGKGLAGIAGLFHHAKGRPTPPAAAIVKPSKGVFVVHVAGSLPPGDLSRATDELYKALTTHFYAHMTNASSGNLAKTADGICGTNRDNTIATGDASAKMQRHGFTSRAQYTFVLQIYTCFGAKLAEGTGTADSLGTAVQKAVEAYAAAHPGNG